MKNIYTKTSIVSFLLALVLAGGFGVSSISAEEEDLEDLQNNLEDLQEKQESYSSIVELKQKEAEVYDSQIRSLAAQEQQISNDIEENEETLSQLVRDIDSLEQDIASKEKAIVLQKEILSNLVRSYYDRTRSGATIVLAAQQSGDSMFASQDRIGTLQGKVGEVLAGIVSTKAGLEEDKADLEGKREKIEGIKDKLEKQRVYLDSAQAQKKELLDDTLTEKGKYAWRLDKVEEEMREILEKISAIETAKLAILDLDNVPDFGGGVLGYPIDDSKMANGIRYCLKNQPSICTQDFGLTSFAKTGVYGYDSDGKPNPHNGFDFGWGAGKNIYAAEDGEIIKTGNDRYYGNWIAIEHEFDDDKRLITIYAHLSSIKKGKGKDVERGDKIGIMGNSGYVFGPTGVHLHFGVYQREGFEFRGTRFVGAKLDPKLYLK